MKGAPMKLRNSAFRFIAVLTLITAALAVKVGSPAPWIHRC